MPPIRRSLLAHLCAAALFAMAVLIWTYPLARHLNTHLPGAGAGDNVTFLWNAYWMREAIASPSVQFFDATALFFPFGVDLTQHTHTAAHALVAATLLGHLPPITAQNLIILASLWLNGFTAYLLALDVTGHRPGSVLAGLIFGGSPFVAAHLLGHFNLIAAYPLPLFAVCFRRALSRQSVPWAFASGAVVVFTAYLDYYYVVYSCMFAAAALLLRWLDVGLVRRANHAGLVRYRAALLSALVVLAAAIVLATATGGGEFQVGPWRVSARGTFNLRSALWLAAILLAWSHWKPTCSLAPIGRAGIAKDLRLAGAIIGIALAGAVPLVARAVQLWARGDYVSQEYMWRSAPRGIDLLAFFVGNPQHPLLGNWSRSLYEAMNLDLVEGAAWIGVAPAALLLFAWRARRTMPESRHWWAIGAIFFVWALGAFLSVAGTNTGFFLPQAIARHIPIVGNARMPGRAMVIVYLAMAVLGAMAAAALAQRWKRSAWLPALLGAAIVLDYLPAPFPLYAPERVFLYEHLHDASARGAVIELPLGIRDGFGMTGTLDPAVMYYQTVHGRPIVGGFAARVPKRILRAYDSMPVIGTLLRLSGGSSSQRTPASDHPRLAGEAFSRLGIAHVVLNRALATKALSAYVESSLPLRLVMREGPRELYEVVPQQ